MLVTSFSDDRRRAALGRREQAAGAGIRPATSAGTRDDRPAAGRRSRRARIASCAARWRASTPSRCPSDSGRLRIVTPRLIAAAHRHDVEVHVWTVNDPADMRRLVAMGVDGIVTDRADVALRRLRRLTLRRERRRDGLALCIHCECRSQDAPFG